MIKNYYQNNEWNPKFDSMCYDSGMEIISFDTDKFHYLVGVRGEVDVEYMGETYRHASDFPENLMKRFMSDDYDYAEYDDEGNPVMYINMNNWYELFVYDLNRNYYYVTSDVIDFYDSNNIMELLKDYVEVIEEYYK